MTSVATDGLGARDRTAIEQCHRSLIELGADVPPGAYTGDDSEDSYAEIRFEDLEDPLLAGELLGRIAEVYLGRVFDRGGGRASEATGAKELDPFGCRHGHGVAANKAAISILEEGLRRLTQRAGAVGLHERREVAELLRQAYDLEIDDLTDFAYLLGTRDVVFLLFAKVLQYRSFTFLEALWVRRRAFLQFSSPELREKMSNEFVELISRWNTLGLQFGYLRDALQSEMKERDSRKDVVEELMNEGRLAQGNLQSLSKNLESSLAQVDDEVRELLNRFAFYPRSEIGGGFLFDSSMTPDDVLVQYHETSRQVLAFVFDPIYDSPDKIVSVVRLSSDPKALAGAVDRFSDTLTKLSSNWQDAAAELYLRLVAPLMPYLEGKRYLFIVPSGSLNHLPFQALYDPRQGEPPSMMLLPHAEILGVYMSAPVSTASCPRALFVGINEFHAWPGLARAEAEATALAARHARSRLRGWRRAWSKVMPTGTVARMGSDTTLLLGSRGEARKDTVLEQMGKHDIVHVASHAEFDRRAMRSFVVVQGVGDEDARISGFDLLASEVSLEGALVVLSACNTGRLQTDRGEDPLGLASALLIAGARAVVVSHWPVADRSTELLMRRFYDELAGGATVEGALATASKWLRTEHPAYAHPYYWAGFVVVGDGRWRLPARSGHSGDATVVNEGGLEAGEAETFDKQRDGA